jgi:hypothetical protein
MQRYLVAIVTLFAVLAVPVSRLHAQSVYGSIVGTVTDASGAVVPGATITVTNLGTNDAKSIKTDASGNFNATNLQPADYKVSAEKTNFKRFVRQPITVAVGATVRADVAFQVGNATTETVEVTTQAPLLQTDSGSLSTEVEGKTVEEMPLNGRNTMNLLALAAGVVPQGSTAGGTGQNQGSGHTMVAAFGNYQIGGALAGSNAAYIDGASVNTFGGGLSSNQTALIMTQDAVQEFNVASNNVSAEFGRFGGGVINMASKSGTNSIHGSVYEYFRNRILNANDWFNKREEFNQGQANKPLQWNQNQYGVAIGGPVLKDKLFYHFTWEGFKSTTGQITGTDVPTAAMQAGTFNHAITDPLNREGCITTSGSGAAETWSIASSCWDPMAAVMKTYFPAPTQPNVALGTGYNYYASPATPDKQNQYNARADYTLSANQRLFARYTYWSLFDSPQNELGNFNGWNTAKSSSANFSQQAVLGDTYTISQNTILDVRLSYLRDANFSAKPTSLGQDFSKFPNSYLTNTTVASGIPVHTLPTAAIGGNAWSLYDVNVSDDLEYYDNYALTAGLIHQMGNHSLKIGGEIRLMQDNYAPGSNSGFGGSFAFNGGYTNDPYADFLLGYEQGGSGMRGPNSSIATALGGRDYNYYQGYYLTDTWQATHKLTVNLGLRYELPGGILAHGDNNAVLLPTTTDPIHNVKGTMALVNSQLYSSRSAVAVKDDLFAPRVGLAYRLGSDTTLRGGYGLSYLPVDSSTGGFSIKSPLVSYTTQCGTGNPTTPIANQLMSTCFGVNNPIIQPPGRSGASATGSVIDSLHYFNGQSISGPVPDQRAPYTQQWNLSIAHQFKGDLMFEVGYAASKGTFIPINNGFSYDQIPDGSYNAAGNAVTSNTDNGLSLQANSTVCSGLSVGQCLRPYSYYGGVNDSLAYHGSISYNSLQLKGEKRFGSSGTLMGNFVWGKQIGDTDTGTSFFETASSAGGFGSAGSIQDYNNLKAERSILSFDVPYRAVITYILNLPFGQGQRFGHDASGVTGHAISGWAVSGITSFQKGFPVPIMIGHGPNVPLANNFGSGMIRPNYDPSCGGKASKYSGNGRVAGWFNASCFTSPGQYAFGNESRVDNSITADGIDNFDFTALKSTKVTEKTDVQFRAEFFNIFNRKQFAPPDANLNDGASFGTIQSSGGNQPRLVQLSLRVNF